MAEELLAPVRRRFALFVAGLFFFSGFAALVYQVTWMRHLALFFGSDVYSAAITLSTFMGGLSLGSYIAEHRVDGLKRPLFWYGVIEIAIGVYAFFFADVLNAFNPALKRLYAAYFASTPAVYQTARVAIAAVVLILPTTLMGATLPLIVRRFVTRDSELGRFGGFFYSVNTLGALSGVLLATFILFPLAGIAGAARIAVAINIVVGLSVIAAARQMRELERAIPATPAEAASQASARAYSPHQARVALIGIAISGMAALALEVVWTRILTLSFSATVYSFALMLACFLFGIYYGSRTAATRVDDRPSPLRDLGYLELGIGVSVALLGLASYVAPSLFGRLLWTLTSIFGQFGTASVVATLLVSGLCIVVPTTLLGATFPTAVRICTPGPEQAGYGTARVYAANTAGAIAGALLAGFWWVPAVGSHNTLAIIAGLFVLNGLWLLYHAAEKRVRVFAEPGTVSGWATATAASVLVIALPQQSVMNYSLQRSTQPDRIYHAEGVAHSIDIIRGDNGQVLMMVDGNTEADTSYTQRRHFILKGHLPLLLHSAPRDVAVIGLGLGITLAATERNAEVRSIQLIELNPEMVDAHAHLREVTGGVLEKPKVAVRIDDGRNFLAMSPATFDMITADPIHPRITGVGYLFTKDYYEAIRARLKPGGVVCQWMPMYNISRESFDVAFRTFASVFQNASFWYVRGHGLFVATDGPFTIDYAALRGKAAHAAAADDLASVGIDSADELLAHLLMGPEQVRAYLASSRVDTVNTDANAYLEYHTPFEFLGRTEEIVRELEPYAGFDPDLMTNITGTERSAVMRAWAKRRGKLLSELNEPLN